MKVKIEDEKIYVISDYNKEFIKRARYLQGKWESPYWVFPEEIKKGIGFTDELSYPNHRRL